MLKTIVFLSLFVSVFISGIVWADHPYSGGDTTYVIPRAQMADRGAFSRPAENLSLTRKGDHFAGNSFFQNAWVTAPASTKARDGLGPLFNTMSCQSCHIKDGRGRPPEDDEEILSMLIRISVEGGEDHDAKERLGVYPDPVYGTQIQNHGIAHVKPEASVLVKWKEIEGTFPDGSVYQLRSPEIEFTYLGYGKLSDNLLVSPRVTPALIGVGLLDTIPDATLEQLSDPFDKNDDGISGRLNQVWSAELGKVTNGRFGWKAEQPTIRQQVAAAFAGDIGVTSSLFPGDTLSAIQREMIDAPDGGTPEVSDEILDLVAFYCKTLAVPARRSHDQETIVKGEALFREANCIACHVEALTTGIDIDFPELSKQVIHPYTDLLLHDMGEGLADNRPSFEASGQEWRTPPLWGIGLVYRVNRHTLFLHDGRARNMEEAILWHGGEAETSRDAYMNLSAEERRMLLAFLKSL